MGRGEAIAERESEAHGGNFNFSISPVSDIHIEVRG